MSFAWKGVGEITKPMVGVYGIYNGQEGYMTENKTFYPMETIDKAFKEFNVKGMTRDREADITFTPTDNSCVSIGYTCELPTTKVEGFLVQRPNLPGYSNSDELLGRGSISPGVDSLHSVGTIIL